MANRGLYLKLNQAESIKDQIEAALKGTAMGFEGKLTMRNGCIVEWDNKATIDGETHFIKWPGWSIRLEIPEQL